MKTKLDTAGAIKDWVQDQADGRARVDMANAEYIAECVRLRVAFDKRLQVARLDAEEARKNGHSGVGEFAYPFDDFGKLEDTMDELRNAMKGDKR